MIARVLRLIALPLVLVLISTIARFTLGALAVPYTERTNAITSVFMLTLISSVYYGALSKRLAGFGWGGTLLTGYTLGLYVQILIFLATLLSYLIGIDGTSYFTNWDSLNVAEGTRVALGDAMKSRVGGLIIGPLLPTVCAVIGRLLAPLLPAPAQAPASPSPAKE